MMAHGAAQLLEGDHAKFTVTEREQLARQVLCQKQAPAAASASTTGCPAGHGLILKEQATHP